MNRDVNGIVGILFTLFCIICRYWSIKYL